MLTTIYNALHANNISLVGGTGDGRKVSANGRVYQDAVAYALVKNLNGKVKIYKENIYHQRGNQRFIASGTDKASYLLGQLNGTSAKQVYQNILHMSNEIKDLVATVESLIGDVEQGTTKSAMYEDIDRVVKYVI